MEETIVMTKAARIKLCGCKDKTETKCRCLTEKLFVRLEKSEDAYQRWTLAKRESESNVVPRSRWWPIDEWIAWKAGDAQVVCTAS